MRKPCTPDTFAGREDWENPYVFGRNKEPGHELALPYDDCAGALQGGGSPWRLVLDGRWKFHWVKRPEDRPVDRAAHPGEELPHHCAFVDAPFSDRSLRLDCGDHVVVAPDRSGELWTRFVA